MGLMFRYRLAISSALASLESGLSSPVCAAAAVAVTVAVAGAAAVLVSAKESVAVAVVAVVVAVVAVGVAWVATRVGVRVAEEVDACALGIEEEEVAGVVVVVAAGTLLLPFLRLLPPSGVGSVSEKCG
jgi:hypothetical protein